MTYKDLTVWQKAMDLVVEIYKLVKFLPREEVYALSDQMRRAAVSIPSNIAEGYSRNTSKEYMQFLSIAKGSTSELQTQLFICLRLNYFEESQAEIALNLCEEVSKILSSIIVKIKNKG